MTEILRNEIEKDIVRCQEAQNHIEGSQELFNELTHKYDEVFKNFSHGITQYAKAIANVYDYRRELNNLKSKLEGKLLNS
ncbi:MAG: hypothetical protein FWE22_05200 [Firmicutes bacterium]|nr:hypothetical protein [Bacillota bacterium]